MENNNANRVYVIDTETTGLNPDEDEILQLSIIDESGCIICDRLFRPERLESWEEAEKINHITPSMVSKEPAFKAAVPQLNEIFSRCGTVIGYRTGFDLAFLKKAGVEFREDMKVIDVQAMFMPIAGKWDWEQNKYKWQSLVKCAEYCGYEWRGNAHDSLADALATLHCYKTLATKNGTMFEDTMNKPICDIGNLLEQLMKGKDNFSKCPFCGRKDEMYFMELNGVEYTRVALCRHCDANIYKRRSDGVWEYTIHARPDYDFIKKHLSEIRKIYPATEIRVKDSDSKGWNVYTIDIKGGAQ